MPSYDYMDPVKAVRQSDINHGDPHTWEDGLYINPCIVCLQVVLQELITQ